MKRFGLVGSPSGLWRGALTLCVLARVLVMNGYAAAEAPQAAQAMLEATFKIKNQEQAGTCFLVAAPARAGWPADRAILVTAGHTFQKTTDADFSIVMRVARGQD